MKLPNYSATDFIDHRTSISGEDFDMICKRGGFVIQRRNMLRDSRQDSLKVNKQLFHLIYTFWRT